MNPILPVNQLISNFFIKNNFYMLYSQTVLKHLIAFLTAMALKGFNAKIVDVAEASHYHRTTLSHFICKGKWNDAPIKDFIKSYSFEYIQKRSTETGKPMFISIDDTISVKAKPSSEAKRPIEGTEYHYSHLENKQVWGHQAVAAMISCDNMWGDAIK